MDSLQDIGFSFVLVDSFTGGQLVDGCMNIGQKLYFFPAWLQIRGGILCGKNILMAALSLRSLDYRRQYPADLAGYHCRCPSGKPIAKREVINLCGSSVVIRPFPRHRSDVSIREAEEGGFFAACPKRPCCLRRNTRGPQHFEYPAFLAKEGKDAG